MREFVYCSKLSCKKYVKLLCVLLLPCEQLVNSFSCCLNSFWSTRESSLSCCFNSFLCCFPIQVYTPTCPRASSLSCCWSSFLYCFPISTPTGPRESSLSCCLNSFLCCFPIQVTAFIPNCRAALTAFCAASPSRCILPRVLMKAAGRAALTAFCAACPSWYA